jgi:predicted  nucleic acid-binding Zn-ribbon protein
MSHSQESFAEPVSLSARNVGGIDETTVDISPGVTVLEGRNATNRTSLLQAIMAGCGNDEVAIKADADAASVSMTVDGETVERTLTRENGEVIGSGEPLLEELEPAELFAFLLESNESRRAVARGEDLRELIMRPVDTGAIRRDIRQAEERKRTVDQRLDELRALESEEPALDRREEELTTEIEETEATLAEVEAEIDAASAEVADEREEQQETEEKLAELRTLRNQLDDVRYERETERESLQRLRAERAELTDELNDLPEPETRELEAVQKDLDDRREERGRLERKLAELDTVVQFNSEMLEDSRGEVRDALAGERSGDGSESVTNRLVDDSSPITCWTCGSNVEPDEIERTVDLLRDLRAKTADEKDEVQTDINRLEARKDELEEQRQRHTDVRRRLDRIDEEVDAGESTLEDLDEQREALEADIERTEQAVEQLRNESRSELLDLHERANKLERELGRLGNERDTVEAELEDVRSGLAQRDSLEAERERLQDELVDLRTRIERIETEAIDSFNEHMETVLSLLSYDNLDRVWIERTGTDGTGATEASFDLHIVRNAEGTVYEDTVDHLSESEREVVGLVFALAGYLVHDVHESCPFILLDSLEAIDADRIAALVDYFEEYSDYLVVALLPEDAAAVDSEYERVTDI